MDLEPYLLAGPAQAGSPLDARAPARSSSSNRNSSKTRTPSLTRRGSSATHSPRLSLPEDSKRGREERGRQGRLGDAEASTSSRTLSPVAVRASSKARSEAKEVKMGDVLPAKRVKVGARASIACACCRKRKVRCSGDWPTCAFCQARTFDCVYEGHPAEFGGTTSGMSFAPGPSQMLALPPPFQPTLPPVFVLLEAQSIFLDHYSHDAYFLNRRALAAAIADGTAPLELVFCILAFAARFSPTLQAFHTTSPASQHFASVARHLLSLRPPPAGPAPVSAEPEPTLLRCQVLLLLGLYECTEGLERQGWTRVGEAIRMAQVLRLGFEDEEDSTGRPLVRDQLSEISEARRRTYWACFVLERLITDGKDRPCALRVPQSTWIRLPGPDADSGGARSSGALFNPCPEPWASVRFEPVVEADLYGQTVRAAELWNRVTAYIGGGGRFSDRRAPWLPESGFAVLERELKAFETRLPPEFRNSEGNLVAHSLVNQGRQYAMLHLLFACSTLVLHRDYLPFLPNSVHFDASKGPVDGEALYGTVPEPADWWMDCLARSFEAANAISNLCTRLAQLGSQITHPFAGYACLAAGTLHLHLKFWPQSYRGLIDPLHYVEQDQQLLLALTPLYPIANSWCESFQRLHKFYHLVVASGGVLEEDPTKLRSSVIKLLRTVDENDEPGGEGSMSPPFDLHLRAASLGGLTAALPLDRSFDQGLDSFGLGGLDLLTYVDSDWPQFLSSPPQFLSSPPHLSVRSPPATEIW